MISSLDTFSGDRLNTEAALWKGSLFSNSFSATHATIRDYLLPWATFCDYSRLFPLRFCSIRDNMQGSNLIYIKNILVYSVNNEKKYMIAFNRTKWKLCDYSWRFISRPRLLPLPFAIYVDNIKLWKYCNILSSNTKFTRLFVTILCRERHIATIRGYSQCDFVLFVDICKGQTWYILKIYWYIVLTMRKKNIIAFNRTKWKLCDYSWRFISRPRLLPLPEPIWAM